MVVVQKCPKCSSLDIDFYAGGLTGAYHCKRCGYIGPIISEEDVEVKKKI